MLGPLMHWFPRGARLADRRAASRNIAQAEDKLQRHAHGLPLPVACWSFPPVFLDPDKEPRNGRNRDGGQEQMEPPHHGRGLSIVVLDSNTAQKAKRQPLLPSLLCGCLCLPYLFR